MLLIVKQSNEMPAKHGRLIKEYCDRCGQLLSPVHFARQNDAGVWCSCECRDGREAHATGTRRHCHAALPRIKRRESPYCDNASNQAAYRSKAVTMNSHVSKLSVTKMLINAIFGSKNTGDGVLSHPGTVSRVLNEICSEAETGLVG